MNKIQQMQSLFNISFDKMDILDKHYIYQSQYKPNSLYWGLGIENEVYLEFEKRVLITKREFLENHKPERYSLNYFANYKPDTLKDAMSKMADIMYSGDILDMGIDVPFLIKSHSFSKTDSNNNPQLLPSGISNLCFSGKTFLDDLSEVDSYFRDTEDIKWTFDGDIIEFPTRQFYNTTLQKVANELSETKNEFIMHLNSAIGKLPTPNFYKKYGPIRIMQKNYPFAEYATNIDQISTFNSGTLHYNLTLPTELDENGIIRNMPIFVYQHCRAIRAIQWMEPFLLAVYGTPDPFSQIDASFSKLFSAASQRCAVSRYIGIGTYDTETMERGKILTRHITDIEKIGGEKWWFKKYYEENAYVKLNEIGMDINFNKHYQHGIEIRFLENLSKESDIIESFEFIIYLMDFILDPKYATIEITPPCHSPLWNELVLRVMRLGKNVTLTSDELIWFQDWFQFETPIMSNTIIDVFDEINERLIDRYADRGGLYSSIVLSNTKETKQKRCGCILL